ncbi:MAG: FtsX-like permease family protein, partial [Proteobacteria bacterium]|nr:FtsX-like permease family protein [Pseudomonadota bacterium]
LPGVGGVDAYRFEQVLYRDRPIAVAAVVADVLARFVHFGWYQGGDEAWRDVAKGAVIISESFHRLFDLGLGDRIVLEGAAGPATLEVAGVFYDYTTEHGVVMMDRSTYRRLFGDPTIDSLAVFLEPGLPDPGEVIQEISRRAAPRGLPVVGRAELHGNILAVFDSTFAVTRSMRVLAVVVAFFGIAGALVTLYLERQREFGVYRALGFSTAQVAAMTLVEGIAMGLVSLLLSLGVGTVLALVLVRVINVASFHWTVFFRPAWAPYLTAAATALLASAAAAAYPVWRVWRTFPQMQIREE